MAYHYPNPYWVFLHSSLAIIFLSGWWLLVTWEDEDDPGDKPRRAVTIEFASWSGCCFTFAVLPVSLLFFWLGGTLEVILFLASLACWVPCFWLCFWRCWVPILGGEDPTKKRTSLRKTFTRRLTSKKANEPTWFGGLSGSPTAEDAKGSSANVDEAKVVNLMTRFPHHSEAQIHEALAACEGHAGRAAKILLNTLPQADSRD